MLYQGDGVSDQLMVLTALDAFAEGFQLGEVAVDLERLETVLRGMRKNFPAKGGLKAASPFKKAANFLCHFVACQPVKDPFPVQAVGATIAEIPNHQNVMVGLHIAIDALHNSTIERKDGRRIVLAERIRMSRHSYIDTVQACSSLAPRTHFHIVSVLLEQLSYRFNPGASYDLVAI